MSDVWDKLWYDKDKRTNYQTQQWLKDVKAEGDRMKDKLEAIKSALILWKKDCDGEFGIDPVFDDITKVVENLLKIAEEEK